MGAWLFVFARMFCSFYERWSFARKGAFGALPVTRLPKKGAEVLDRSSFNDYANEVLMLLNTVLTAVATLLTPPMQTSAISATSSAYSTRS